MKRTYLIVGAAVLSACLAGWAALAVAQSGPAKPPEMPAGDPVPAPTMPEVPGAPAAPPSTLPPLPQGGDTAPPLPPLPDADVKPAAGPGRPLPSGLPLPDSLPPLPGTGPAPIGRTPGAGPAEGTGPAPLPVGKPMPGPDMIHEVPGTSAPTTPVTELPGTSVPPAGPIGPGVPLPQSGPMPTTEAPTAPPLPAGPATPEGLPAPTPGPAPGTEAGTGPVSFPAPTPMSDPVDGVSGKQEPSVSLEWVGPTNAKLGVPADFSLAVRNTSRIPVQQVLVRVRLPGGLRAAATEPHAVTEGNVLVWDLGSLQAGQDKSLKMSLVADSRGDLVPQAWVTFTGSALTRIKVREPKLVVKVAAPRSLLVGDPASFTLTVSNPGDGSADGVRIHATLSDGLEHPRGSKVELEIGNLAAGESRNVALLCGTRAVGAQHCDVVAEADGGLNARDRTEVTVALPRIDLQVAGPALRYLGRKAVYTFRLSNPGTAPAANVSLTDSVPDGFKVLGATHGGRHDPASRTVTWFIGEVPAGQSREVQLEVQAANPGDHKHKVAAAGARNLHAEAELNTHVEGLSALLVEMVDTEDPIEVGSDTAYEVRITNTGSKPETDIKIVATVPEKMELKTVQGARYQVQGQTVICEPIAQLAPRADAIIRFHIKGKDAGTVRFKIQVTSTNLTEPVIKMEATRIYADTPDARSSSAPN